MNPIEELINSLGAIAEVSKIFYERLTGQGFSQQEALYLCGEFIKATVSASRK